MTKPFTLDEAKALGVTAFHEGHSGVPALNKEFMARLAAHCKDKPIGHGLGVLEAFNAGYMQEQRKQARLECKALEATYRESNVALN